MKDRKRAGRCFGNLHDVNDVDFFSFETNEEMSGRVRFTLHTAGTSLLRPSLTVMESMVHRSSCSRPPECRGNHWSTRFRLSRSTKNTSFVSSLLWMMYSLSADMLWQLNSKTS